MWSWRTWRPVAAPSCGGATAEAQGRRQRESQGQLHYELLFPWSHSINMLDERVVQGCPVYLHLPRLPPTSSLCLCLPHHAQTLSSSVNYDTSDFRRLHVLLPTRWCYCLTGRGQQGLTVQQHTSVAIKTHDEINVWNWFKSPSPDTINNFSLSES